MSVYAEGGERQEDSGETVRDVWIELVWYWSSTSEIVSVLEGNVSRFVPVRVIWLVLGCRYSRGEESVNELILNLKLNG